MKQLRSVDLKRLHRSWQRRTTQRVALLLDGVQDPFNVGAIVRTAAALRVEHLYLANATSPDHSKAGKTAMGTERYLDWSQHEHAADAIAAARHDGFVLVGIELTDAAAPLFEIDVSGDVCLVIGNENRGLTADTLAACDSIGYIPQLGRVGSLNVATATAIAVYEARRQGWTVGGTE